MNTNVNVNVNMIITTIREVEALMIIITIISTKERNTSIFIITNRTNINKRAVHFHLPSNSNNKQQQLT